MKYDAFISYRHTPLDMEVAKSLHKALETYHVPKSVRQKTGKKRIERVFRDQEELPTSNSLSSNIDEALENSENLIVICSPDTPHSMWVEREIETFISLHGRNHVLALLIDGEPSESFPEILLKDDHGNNVEPLAADIRARSESGRKKKLSIEKLRLLAAILGCSFDDLKQRQKERKIRTVAGVSMAAAVLMLAFGVYSFRTMMLIKKNYRQSQINESQYLSEKSISLTDEGDRRLGALAAKEALPTVSNDRPYVASAEYALQQALGVYTPSRTFTLDYDVKSNFAPSEVHFNKDGSLAIAADMGGEVNVWDTENGSSVAYYKTECGKNNRINSVKDAFLTGDNHAVIVYSDYVSCRDLSGNVIWNSDSITGSYSYTEYSPESGYLATAQSKHTTVFNTKDGSVIYDDVLDDDKDYTYTQPLAFDASGKHLAMAKVELNLLSESSDSAADTSASVNGTVSDDSSLSGNGTPAGEVISIDLNTGKVKHVRTRGEAVYEIKYNADGTLLIASSEEMDIADFTAYEQVDYTVQCLDIDTSEELWSGVLSTKSAIYTGESLKFTYIEDKYVLVTAENVMQCYDLSNGALISSFDTGTSIKGSIVYVNSVSQGNLMLIERNGMLDNVNFLTGVDHKDNVIDTGITISKSYQGGGRIYLRRENTNDIIDLAIITGPDFKSVNEFEDEVDSAKLSPDESIYAISLYTDDYVPYIGFYNTADNSLISTWKMPEDNGNMEDYRIINDKTAVIITGDGSCHFFNIRNGKEKAVLPDKDGFLPDTFFSPDSKFIITSDTSGCFILNVSNRKVSGPYDITADGKYTSISRICIMPDKKTLFFATNEDGLCSYDIKTGKITAGLGGGLKTFNGRDDADMLSLSDDGKYLAIACTDSTLKVMDTKTLQIIGSVPYYCNNYSLIRFTPDSRTLILQGDDLKIKIMDVKTSEIESIQEENTSIKDVSFYKDDNLIVMKGLSYMLLYDWDTFSKKASAEGGLFVSPKNGIVMSEKYGLVGSYPYLDLKGLLAEEEKQYGSQTLTAAEKAALY